MCCTIVVSEPAREKIYKTCPTALSYSPTRTGSFTRLLTSSVSSDLLRGIMSDQSHSLTHNEWIDLAIDNQTNVDLEIKDVALGYGKFYRHGQRSRSQRSRVRLSRRANIAMSWHPVEGTDRQPEPMAASTSVSGARPQRWLSSGGTALGPATTTSVPYLRTQRPASRTLIGASQALCHISRSLSVVPSDKR